MVFSFWKTNEIKPVLTGIFVTEDKIGLSKEKIKKNYIYHCELDGKRDFSDENGSEIHCDFF